MTDLALLAVVAVAAGLSRLGHRALTRWERSRDGDQEHVVTTDDRAEGVAAGLGAAPSAGPPEVESAGPPPGLPGAGGPT